MRNIPVLLAIMFLVGCAAVPIIPPPQPKPDAPHFWTYKEPNYPPLVKVAPVYPNNLMSQGKEGWVLVEYALNNEGVVIAPTVVESSPKSEFDKSALTAITKWRYTPKVASALNASTNPKLQRLFTFELQ